MTVFPPNDTNVDSRTVDGEFTNTSVIKKMSEWNKVMTAEEHQFVTKLEHTREEPSDRDSKVQSLDEEDISSNECEVKSSQNEATTKTESSDADTKPSHSYIALIAMAILSKPSKKVLLGDIYSYISENFPYYRSKDKSWRNSIRHNLSLNECFIKAGRSENGKGNYWAVHPANVEDFANGDFRRRRARRRVRKSHSLCTRYGSIPYQQHAFLNYRSPVDPYLAPSTYYLTPFNLPNCVRKNNFGIDSLLSPARVPLTSGLQNPMEYTTSASICQSAMMRAAYTQGQSFASGTHQALSYPAMINDNPSESWHETWKKLKAKFQT
ncbi:fork head domain-containing protein FD5-like [Dendronephthya gigantea]|uniref:fork head domain-containing protein FD5-like n=1 Tax=Dendronephthya gigantea TaxID=151771 RepID=UPI00106DB4D8|nr:fork head domain-containing protein FD5-like [Dendronephthya gigantea]